MTKQDMTKQEILTKALAKIDVLFGMRKTLQKYGIPCTEPIIVSLKFGDKEVETKKFPGMPKPVRMESSEEDMKTVVTDLLNKAEVLYEFASTIGLSKEQPVTVVFKYGEKLNNKIALALNWCCPCPLDPSKECCFC